MGPRAPEILSTGGRAKTDLYTEAGEQFGEWQILGAAYGSVEEFREILAAEFLDQFLEIVLAHTDTGLAIPPPQLEHDLVQSYRRVR
jgi:LmbE family N-acetylglucosaminyl deacetylase